MVIVRNFDKATMTAIIEQRGKFELGQTVEFFQPHEQTFSQTITAMHDVDGIKIFSAPHAQQLVTIPVVEPVEIWSLMRS